MIDRLFAVTWPLKYRQVENIIIKYACLPALVHACMCVCACVKFWGVPIFWIITINTIINVIVLMLIIIIITSSIKRKF